MSKILRLIKKKRNCFLTWLSKKNIVSWKKDKRYNVASARTRDAEKATRAAVLSWLVIGRDAKTLTKISYAWLRLLLLSYPTHSKQMNHAPKWPTEFRRHVASAHATAARTHARARAATRTSDRRVAGLGPGTGPR